MKKKIEIQFRLEFPVRTITCERELFPTDQNADGEYLESGEK